MIGGGGKFLFSFLGGNKRLALSTSGDNNLWWIPLVFALGAFLLCCVLKYLLPDKCDSTNENSRRPEASNQSQTTSSSQQLSQISYQPPQEWLTPPVISAQELCHTQTSPRQQTSTSLQLASETTFQTACGIELSSFYLRNELGEEVCPVCLEQLNMQKVSCGPCSHYVHTECLKRWLSKDKSKSCPVCRANYDT